MTAYNSSSGKKSGVTGYKIGEGFIIIQFNNSKNYTYSYRSAGKTIIEKMKKLALDSKGLSTFISENNPEFE